MSFLPLLALAAFALADPVGDAHGDGSYVLPSQPSISADALDLREFRAQDAEGKMRFTVGFGGVSNPWHLSSGSSNGVTDIFVKGTLSGDQQLTGLNLRTAGSGGWVYHVRVSGAGSRLERFIEGKTTPEALPEPTVAWQGTQLVIEADIPAGEYGYWVTSSVYSPLSPDGVLKPTAQAAPANVQTAKANAPVPVDVLAAPTDHTAYQTNQLAAVGQARDLRAWYLSGLGLCGLFITAAATWMKRRNRAGQ